MSVSNVTIRTATPDDADQVLALVGGAGLILSGVAEHIGGFLVADDRGSIVGSAGLEVYDGVGLLRSVAVAPAWRRQGLGGHLVLAALAAARRHGLDSVVLLTETAAPFFSRLGFRELARERVDPRLLSSAEFTSPSCATAVVMSMNLSGQRGGEVVIEAEIKNAVREHYTRAAGGDCCGPDSCGCGEVTPVALEFLGIPSFGCGTPVEAAALRSGEVVLDLGSGPGLDAFRAAQWVGTQGRVIGVDMTPAMIARAQEDAARLGFAQIEFRQGEIEQLPVDGESVDVVLSNCVLNLIPDKTRAFTEAFRVLKTGGRMVVSDMVRAEPRVDSSIDPERWAACVDGAEPEPVYLERMRRAGFVDAEILSRGGGDVYSVTIRARKP